MKFLNKNNIRGFSLIEILLVVAVLAIVSVAGVATYFNYAKSVELKSVLNTMSFDLKQVQSKSMTGDSGLKWGLHIVNGTKDYYEIFSTPTDYNDVSKVISSSVYLPISVSFSDPASSTSKDIIFNKISGGTTSSSVVLTSQGITKTISISSIGNISNN